MSLGAITGLARELRRLDRENRNRAPGAPRGDLLDQARRAERLAAQLRVPDLLAAAALRLGDILLASDDAPAASAAFGQAARALGGLRQPDLAVVVAARRTEALAALERWDEVEAVAGAGIEVVERYRYKVSSPFLQTTYLKSRIALYGLGATAALRRGDLATALQRCELAKARAVLADVAGQPTSAEPDEEGPKRQLAAVNAALERAEAAGQHAEAERLRAERHVVWDLLMMQRRRRRTDAAPARRFVLAELQSRLAPEQAALYHFWLAPERLLQVAFDRRRVWFGEMAVEPGTTRELDAYARRILSAGSDGARPPADLLDDVRRFAGLLWPAAADAQDILGPARRLVVSPHRKLHPLPAHALKRDEGFLIETHAVRYAPNLTCLLEPPPEPRRGVAALGVREFRVPGVELAPLPHAEDEADAVAATYRAAGQPGTALTGAAASEAALRAGRMAGAGCVHFACHGANVDPQSPMEACLFLRDGKVEGIELPLLDLDAPLVVLTACCSGQRWLAGRHLDELPGDDVMGLQAAFFAAGAREILSTSCPVMDRPGMLISTAFHRHRAAGAPSDLAWQGAVREYLASAARPERHRAFWAPFQLIATTL